MARRRKVELNDATRAEIKRVARCLMAEKGTAGLSLRAIAREMGISAPALYHYYGSLDDLITALILDAFEGHAAYVRSQRDLAAADGASHAQQIWAAVLAYRDWALQNPVDFQLIYGNPIPGYEAPSESTVPAARLLGQVFMESVQAALAADEAILTPAYSAVPSGVLAHYRDHFGMEGQVARAFHLMNQTWGMMHGLVALEIYNHATPVFGDTDAFYAQALRRQLQTLGLALD